MTKVRNDAAGFRTLAVSYCSHDIYAGMLSTDPTTRTRTRAATRGPRTACSRSRPRSSSCSRSTRRRSSSCYGGSAGSAGTYGVAWALQRGGNAPAGIIADASIVNQEAIVGRRTHAGIAAADNTDPGARRCARGSCPPRPREHRQRARQARGRRSLHRAGPARVEPRRPEHLRVTAGACARSATARR